MVLGRLSRRYLFVTFLVCLWMAALDALPTEGPYLGGREAQSRTHWQYPRDSNTTLENSTTTWAVLCVYPVSGIYTRMQRLLFYVITAFVFLLRSYDWLIAVGMTFVLTYASAACIHAFSLSTLHGIGPDFDVLALQGIIVSTTIAICCYSISSRRISEYAIAPLFYVWISAMVATSIAIFVSSNGILGNLATFIVPAGCSADGKCNPSVCSNNTSHDLFRSPMDQLVPIALEQWMYYNASDSWLWNGYYPFKLCLDCDGLSYSNGFTMKESLAHTSSGILRIGSYLLTFVLAMSSRVVSPLLFMSSKSRNVVFFHFLMEFQIFGRPIYLGVLALSYVSDILTWWIIHPLLSYKFRKAKESILFYDLPTASEVKPWHIYVAKLLASCWFVCSCSARLILLMLPVVTVVLSELGLACLPESEAPRLVGQWAPFVYVGLALLASLILKFLNCFRRVGVQEQRRIIYLSYPDSTGPLQSPLCRLTENYERNLLLSPCLIWEEFRIWWNDPVNVAKQDYKFVRRQLRFQLMAARRRAASRVYPDSELSRLGIKIIYTIADSSAPSMHLPCTLISDTPCWTPSILVDFHELRACQINSDLARPFCLASLLFKQE